MKKLATGTMTALLIAATTSLAMAQGQPDRTYYHHDQANYSQDYNTSPGSTNAGVAQER